MIDYEPTEWMQEIIVESQKKYPKIHNQLILLLHPNEKYPNLIFQESDIKLNKLSTDYFKGIYYIIPPMYKDERGKAIPSMFITIKDAFPD